MTLIEKIEADFIAAFKAKEIGKKNFLGVIKGEVQNQQGRGTIMDDENVLTIVRKMEKSLKETGTESAMIELEFLKPYLPSMMSNDKIESVVKELISSGKNNMGLIMKEFSTTYKGLADNKLVSQVVNKMLAADE